MARNRKAPGAEIAAEVPRELLAQAAELRRKPLYDLPKTADSKNEALQSLRERPPFDDEWLDTPALALVFKVSASYFEKLRVSGGGPPWSRIGSNVRYLFSDAKRWAVERARRSTSEAEQADAA